MPGMSRIFFKKTTVENNRMRYGNDTQRALRYLSSCAFCPLSVQSPLWLYFRPRLCMIAVLRRNWHSLSVRMQSAPKEVYMFLTPCAKAALLTAAAVLSIVLAGLLIRLAGRLILFVLSLAVGRRGAEIAGNYLTFPGTLVHELSHALAALLAGARVTSVSLVPRGNTLGSVRIVPRGGPAARALQRTLSSLAPVFGGGLCLYLLRRFVLPLCSAWWSALLFGYLFVSILLHMDLSVQDLRTAAKGVPLCLLLLFALFLLLVYLDPDLDRELLSRIPALLSGKLLRPVQEL